jgi:hypothetical protein
LSLVTVARYIAITGDDTTAASAVEEALDAVEAELEDELDRPLANDEYTESLRPDRGGMLWPRATPITDGGDYLIDGLGLRADGIAVIPSFISGDDRISVTYTGGWTVDTIPRFVERAIAWAAHALTHPTAHTPGDPAIKSKRVGDVAVTYRDGGPQTRADAQIVWPARVLRYRYSVPRGTGR